MSVHTATAANITASRFIGALTYRRPARAANDNHVAVGDEKLLHAALRHFAEHGLRAAQEARKEAERAFFAGERESYLWWLGVCKTLDRRMAEDLQHATPVG